MSARLSGAAIRHDGRNLSPRTLIACAPLEQRDNEVAANLTV
jgi:hypothetical protein